MPFIKYWFIPKIAETLAYVRDDYDYQREPKQWIDLTGLLTSLCHDFEEAGHQVNYVGTDEKVLIKGSMLALKRAVTNIIENAVHYAGDATIHFIKNSTTIKIMITDQGPGLTNHELEKIFTPFYRGNQPHLTKKNGSGLGLTIARNIIQSHQGELLLTQHQPRGLCVTIIFQVY